MGKAIGEGQCGMGDGVARAGQQPIPELALEEGDPGRACVAAQALVGCLSA